MKNRVKRFVKSLGGRCHYNGNTATMYITGRNGMEIKVAVEQEFFYRSLPFKVEVQDLTFKLSKRT